VSSAGREKASSKSSTTGSIVGCTARLATIVDIEALIVETPSSSSSETAVRNGGRILIIGEDMIEEVRSELDVSPTMAVFAFAPPVLKKSISISQSSSSLSDGGCIGAPSGRSKSASGHSSLESTSVGAGIVVIVYQLLGER
jgi:hypothetical protein